MKRECPRIVLAGTHSGVGKTSVSLGITAALTRLGLRVQTFKVGPDFLDPTHLAQASGRPCYNLDGWMMGRTYVSELFARATANADIAIIEGVMGLFDGASARTSVGSTAEIAQWLEAPVVLVIDAHGAARSVAALVKGYSEFEPTVCLAGVIANRCGSARHAEFLVDALTSASLPPLIGAIPRGAFPSLPSRHLGLVTATGDAMGAATLGELVTATEEFLRLTELKEIAASAAPIDVPAPAARVSAAPLRIGIARDAAFHFYYQDLFDALRERGCELAFFSPLEDARLPDGLAALVLGGGYPEEYAETLSANRAMCTAIHAFADSARPLYAECGGLIYLTEAVTTPAGERFPLVGLLPTSVRMLPQRKMLGYIEAELFSDAPFGKRGDKLRGHEFHYSELEDTLDTHEQWQPAYLAHRPCGDAKRVEGFQRGALVASYVHLHLASRPDAIDNFLTLCRSNP